jgi:flagellar motor switch protein FliN
MNERKSMKQSPKVQSADDWSRRLGGTLAVITGTHATMRRIVGDPIEKCEPMLWWRCSAAPVTYIGVSELDADFLLRMWRRDVPNEAPDSAGGSLAEILGRSWGQGEITTQIPADTGDGEVYQAEFTTGGEVSFHVVQTGVASQEESNLDMLMDIELPITLRFGSTQMALRDVASLNAGSVIQFDQAIDDLVEVMVNGRVVARGEAVMVQGFFGVRISEISSKRERLLTSSFVAVQNRPAQGDQIG